MPSRGQTLTVEYTAWDTVANQPKAGDVANHTLRWIKDGTSSAPANAAAEVDATNARGEYRLTLTIAECTCDFGKLAGVSSTAGVVIIPVAISFEQLPTAAPAAAGGLPTVDGSNNVHGVQSKVAATLAAADVGGNLPVDVRTILTVGLVVPGSGSIAFGNVVGTSVYAGGPVASVAGSVGSVAGVNFPAGFSSLTASAIAEAVWAADSRTLTAFGFSVTTTLDAHATAYLYGPLTVNSDGSWTYFDPGTTTPRLDFGRVAAPGGRTVTLH